MRGPSHSGCSSRSRRDGLDARKGEKGSRWHRTRVWPRERRLGIGRAEGRWERRSARFKCGWGRVGQPVRRGGVYAASSAVWPHNESLGPNKAGMGLRLGWYCFAF